MSLLTRLLGNQIYQGLGTITNQIRRELIESKQLMFMVFAKSLDESLFVWRAFNANYANGTNFANVKRKFASFALFAAFALRVSRLCKSHD